MKQGIRSGASALAMMAMAAMPQVSHADEAGQQSGTVGLEEIVVTAQRKAESAQKAAIAISVVTAEALTKAGVNSAATLNSVAPSLTVAQGGGATTSYFVRGVGNFTNNAYSDPAVAFNYDGVYIGRPTSTGSAFFDLERIEVLKGPQGTLYGRNATGGAVNVLPAKPVIGKLMGAASLGYGNFNAIDGDAMINVPVGDNTAVRLAGKVVDSKGYYSDGTGNTKSQALRAQILTQPSAAVSLRLAADWAHNGGMGVGATYDGLLNFTPGAPASANAPANYTYVPANLGAWSGLLSPKASAFFANTVIGGSFISPAPLDKPFINDTNWGVEGEANLDTSIGKVTTLLAYRKSTLDDLFNGAPSFRGARTKESSHQFSAEVRLAGKPIGPVEWLIGGFFYDENVQGNSTYNQYLVSSIQSYTIGTKSYAGFGRLVFHATDHFRLVAGGRYTRDEKRIDGLANTLLDLCTNAPPPAGNGCFGGPSVPTGLTLADIAAQIPASQLPAGFPTAPGDVRPFGNAGNILTYAPVAVNKPLNNNRFTYRLAAEYDVGPQSLAYLSYETGYRSGGFALATGRETYAPEFIDAYTAGIKNRLMGNRLQINVEAFLWKYRNQQVSHFGFGSDGLTTYFTTNVGKSTIKGVDIDFQFKATPTTLLLGDVQYVDNTLDQFTYNVPRGGTSLPPAVGCPYAPGTEGGLPVYTIDCSGKPGLNSPRWSLNGGIRQDVPLGDYTLQLSLDGRYRSNRVIGFEYLAQHNSGDDFTADASIAFGPQDQSWQLTAWVRNLTDNNVRILTQYNNNVGGVIATSYAPPRTYGARASVKF
ncbi:UNVERIFIED_ORG: iron complex outermembrane receptor protein [Sphingomonas sp. R1F5B]